MGEENDALTEKELKKLNRYQLLELLLRQTEQSDSLQQQIERLQGELAERELRFSQLGSLAEASVYITGLLESAQKTAEIFGEEARKQADRLLTDAQSQAEQILSQARLQAAEIIAQAEQDIRPEESIELVKNSTDAARKRNTNGKRKQQKSKCKRTSKNRRAKK